MASISTEVDTLVRADLQVSILLVTFWKIYVTTSPEDDQGVSQKSPAHLLHNTPSRMQTNHNSCQEGQHIFGGSNNVFIMQGRNALGQAG